MFLKVNVCHKNIKIAATFGIFLVAGFPYKINLI